jgi:hypothetical protein
MATRTIASNTARYDRLNTQDHDRDTASSPRPNKAASLAIHDSSASTTAALPSVVRRRRRDPPPSSVRAMSLVGLKNIFFRQTVTPVPVQHRSGPRILGPDTADVESQDSRAEKANQKKGFKVDARVISDATIGLSDGLTVPFALTAGLSALGNTRVVIYGGFAELIAGAISMGLGGYLGAKSEA